MTRGWYTVCVPEYTEHGKLWVFLDDSIHEQDKTSTLSKISIESRLLHVRTDTIKVF